jgi:hypothetical protein
MAYSVLDNYITYNASRIIFSVNAWLIAIGAGNDHMHYTRSLRSTSSAMSTRHDSDTMGVKS